MEKIGKYQVEEKIGVGGFGEVFRGYDPFIKRRVAIKTCGSDEQEIRDRFFKEAEIGGNLHHRNITTIYDFGVQDDLPYLIQEYLSGEDLDVKIRRRDFLPYPEKLYYLLQIARGLAYAHSKGVIHRDIKPANIRILEDGTAKIMDFGIAKLAQQESDLTQTGMTIGTASYLAPEQVRGEAVDHRTDIFSYGSLAYELLTFERAFKGEAISSVIYQVLHHEPPPITEAWPAAPPELVALIDRCLRKDAAQRFTDGGDLLRDLEKLQKRDRGDRAAASGPTAEETIASPPPARPAETTHRPAEPARPATAVAPTEARAAQAGRGLDDITVGPGAGKKRAPVAPVGAAQAARGSRRSTAVSFGILMILAVAAAGGGFWYGMREDPEATTAEQPAAAVQEGEETILGFPEDVAETGAGEDAPAGEPAGGPPAALPPSTITEPGGEQPASPAPPPPEPARGTLIMPAVGWTDAMTVRIGSRTYPLFRRQTLELAPGDYQATFELESLDYSPPPRTVQIQVVAGESVRLRAPILRPGALSVRPLPSRPQGQVSIDGQALGSTPLSRVRWQPGSHTVEIRTTDGEGDPLTTEIDLVAGEEIILSFDLAAGTVTSRAKALEQ
ncbi:MAG: protein kinase [bacterium]|nr:protein kinase [bacterium]